MDSWIALLTSQENVLSWEMLKCSRRFQLRALEECHLYHLMLAKAQLIAHKEQWDLSSTLAQRLNITCIRCGESCARRELESFTKQV